MRTTIADQLPLVLPPPAHEHGRELACMSEILEACPQVVVGVHEDLTRGIQTSRGRKGMSAEQVLRALVIKQLTGFSYEQLAFHLADSMTYRAFCRFGIADKPPSATALQRDIKRIRPETLESINVCIVRRASELGIEDGRKIRTDSTPIEANVHAPTDSSLLWDCVRTLTRILERAGEDFDIRFSDHRKRAKKRHIAIQYARKNDERVPLYRDLLRVARLTVGYAESAIEQLKTIAAVANVIDGVRSDAYREQLEHFVELTRRVVEQTERRVLRGERVPAAEKLVSIFEPHVDILVKDRRETLFGHKAGITTGASGLILDFFIQPGNWADAGVAVDAVKRAKDVLAKTPQQVCFDGGFTSKDNLAAIKGEGVRDVVFTKAKHLDIGEMARSSWIHRQLKNFRAGVEGGISFLKRAFGLGRCNWRGFDSFKAYALGSVVAANLLIVARRLLS